MPKITVFTVVYNNYGHFILQWVEWLRKQTVKPELLVVLGKDHGADIEYLKQNKINYVFCDSDNMGKLRNEGLKNITTEWWLYFSVDDELLPHACEEIVNTDADAVSLTFDVIEPDGTIIKGCHSPCINTIEELNNWSRCWGGYVAVKGNTDLTFNEHIEVPNLTLHFELFKRGLKTIRSNGVSAIHHRWNESHHFRSKNIRKSFVDEIESTKNEIIEEIIERGDNMIIEALMNYKDNTLGKEIKKGDRYEVSKERGKQILEATHKGKPLAKIIEVIKEEVKIELTSEIEQTIDNVVLTTFADGEKIGEISMKEEVKESNKEEKPLAEIIEDIKEEVKEVKIIDIELNEKGKELLNEIKKENKPIKKTSTKKKK